MGYDNAIYPEISATELTLDVGCGSGVLNIAAVKLGATRVLAVDIDPIAVEATDANVPAQPGRASRIRAREGSVPTDVGPFDTVLANLIAGPARGARAGYRRRARPRRHPRSRRASSSTAKRR